MADDAFSQLFHRKQVRGHVSQQMAHITFKPVEHIGEPSCMQNFLHLILQHCLDLGDSLLHFVWRHCIWLVHLTSARKWPAALRELLNVINLRDFQRKYQSFKRDLDQKRRRSLAGTPESSYLVETGIRPGNQVEGVEPAR